MKKQFLAAVAFLACATASAMPTGMYNLSLTWRDGNFTGQIHYDDAVAQKITQVHGTLVDTAQTTSIDTVWNVVNGYPYANWAFLDDANPVGTNNYDAGFYVTIKDLGTSLAIDTSQPNGLYDWSQNAAFYSSDKLYDSPLISSSITAVNAVPEPKSLALIGLGLLSLASLHRNKLKQK